MNSDNILLKIVTTFNEEVFGRSSARPTEISSMVEEILRYGGYNVSECKFKIRNLSGNLDMCFIYGEVNSDRTSEVINVDDARGTRIISVIFINNLLNKLEKLKSNEVFNHCYKIFDMESGEFLGFATDYSVKNGVVHVKKKDFDRKVVGDHVYKVPNNYLYIYELIYIFNTIIDMIKPNAPANTITSAIYKHASEVLALYSHKVTIGPLSDFDFSNSSLVEMVNKYDLSVILSGKILEAYCLVN